MVNKEHLQFVVMMAPTLLLIAVAVTLALPTSSAAQRVAETAYAGPCISVVR